MWMMWHFHSEFHAAGKEKVSIPNSPLYQSLSKQLVPAFMAAGNFLVAPLLNSSVVSEDSKFVSAGFYMLLMKTSIALL